MMELTTIEEAGHTVVEGADAQPFLAAATQVNRLIEACFAAGVEDLLLYPANLPPDFFDLSSGAAGEILQKLRQYHIRLAVVVAPGSVRFSRRFAEAVDEERQARYFRLVATRAEARAWLATPP